MSRKKVLFLITKSNWGGAQRYVYDIATNLDQSKYEPVVALGGDGELKDKLDAAGIRVISLQSLQRDISIKKEVGFALELWKILRREKPMVFHVNSSKAGGMGCFLGRIAFVPRIIFTAHGWAFNEDRPDWQKCIIKCLHWFTVLFSHQTIAVSQVTADQLNWPGTRKKWRVIHNGRAPIDFIDPIAARRTLGIVSDGIVTGTIGELHPVKGHDVMIRAIAQLRDSGHDLTHVIIGAGKAQAELVQLVQELTLTKHVIFAGAIDEAARYLHAFDIYVQPSHSEALAYTVIEAAQAGLPVIASRVGGIPEIITHGHNGLLVNSGDVEELANNIETLIQDESRQKQLGVEANITSQTFSFSNMLSATTSAYDSRTISSASADSRATD